ncbi:LuxR C-terminal-related transcriptional regulator [Amycolatopsis sp. OK19-0408]|uniref:LuxR C-terminal-related transcriptional regulator n=1 Tax=Amycolatopsis iheyensis TaxID=2945988 RepID=A0A9X2NJV7_9PSEU|nr:LuxR C-terminal-related transcriptional regulator [Amycolatopsis iheyensis]MCR6487834.1 LuxR C-terminal-related transcriptional regulator [Amycolatopsis iheyensis]
MGARVPVYAFAADPISRAGLESQLRFQPSVTLVPEERLAEAAVAVVAAETVDDATLRVLADLKRRGFARLVLLVNTVHDSDLLKVIEAGVCALIRRTEVTAASLAALVEKAACGEATLPSDVLAKLLTQVSRLQSDVLAPRGLRLAGLTDREAAILTLVADGLDTGEIASELSYSVRTVKNALHDVSVRFQLRNRSHAVAFALREGLI